MSTIGPGRAPYSLNRRLTAAVILVLATGGIVVTLAALAFGRQASREAYDRLLFGAASQIAASVALRGGSVQVDLPASAFDLLALAQDDRVFYRVIDSDGRTLTGYDDLQAAPASAQQTQFYDTYYRDAAVRAVAIRRRFAERAFSGNVDVLVGHTRLARQALAWEIVGNALLVLAAAGIAMAGLAVFAVRSALRPLRRIERELGLRDPRDLTPLDVSVPQELQTVVSVINRFMQRLEKQMSIMRNLIADSAHQLRTPIAALRAQAQSAADETDKQRLQAIVERIHDRSVGLSHLADQLLNHAMIIHRADAAPREQIDLRTVAIAVADEYDQSGLLDERTLALQLPEAPVTLYADALSLTEACKNLVNNAARHGQAPITLSVERRGDTVHLAVRDHGIGFATDLQLPVDTRFRHADDTREQGAGLGLSIVNEVALAHGGEFRAGFTDRQEFETSLLLPVSAEAGAQPDDSSPLRHDSHDT